MSSPLDLNSTPTPGTAATPTMPECPPEEYVVRVLAGDPAVRELLAAIPALPPLPVAVPAEPPTTS